MYRDFTYIDDIVEGIFRLMTKPPVELATKHRILNIGNNQPEKLMTFITTLEECLGKSLGKKVEFKKVYENIKPGDVHKTYANTKKLESLIDFRPQTSIKNGLHAFTDWYVSFFNKYL